MLKTENYRFNGFIGLAMGALVLLLSLWGIARALIRSGDVTKHPIMTGLARFGDPRSIAQQLDLEMSHIISKLAIFI